MELRFERRCSAMKPLSKESQRAIKYIEKMDAPDN